jgi:hypothetical protein
MSDLKFKVGDVLLVNIYQLEGTIIDIFNKKRKIYKVQVENQILLVSEDNLIEITKNK